MLRLTLSAGHLAIEKVTNKRKGLVGFVFKHKVARIEQVKLEIPQITLVGMRARLGENEIVFAPNDNRWRLFIRNHACTFGYNGGLLR